MALALSEWLIMPAAAGVKLERPTGRATVTPVTTGAGSWDEKAREGRRAGLKRPVGPPARQDPHDVRSPGRAAQSWKECSCPSCRSTAFSSTTKRTGRGH